MTRETKIGLLVGLAFIIVIGILLSDHINSSSDPVRADATETFKSVEQGVNTPDSRAKSTDVVVAPQRMVPQNPVPVQPESQSRQNSGQTIVTVGPGGDPSSVEIPSRVAPPSNIQQDTIVQDSSAGGPQNTQDPGAAQQRPTSVNSSIAQALANAARQKDEEIVIAGSGSPVGISPGPTLNPQPAPPANTAATGRQVKAEEGDTVSKLAGKYMGGNTKANRDAIIKANPSVGPEGSKVFTGRNYLIPNVDSSVAQKTAPAQPISAVPQPVAPTKTEPVTAGTSWYTVKENDNLWKIASEQLGSGTRWTEIKELNGLKSDDVRVNMRLRLPAKSVASNN